MRDQARNPERAVSLHLARSGSQSERAIWFILPAHGASHIIKTINVTEYPLNAAPQIRINSSIYPDLKRTLFFILTLLLEIGRKC